MEIKKGDVYYIDLKNSDENTHVQKGVRPCVIIQNNHGNNFSPNVIVVPLTTQIKRQDLPIHVKIQDISNKQCEMALCECILTISKDQLISYIKSLDDRIMREINIALMISLGIL